MATHGYFSLSVRPRRDPCRPSHLTDLTVRHLKPVPGKRVTYLDKAIKGFGVRITENGIKTFVLTYGRDRKRVKLGDVGILALKDARDKAKDILAKRQLRRRCRHALHRLRRRTRGRISRATPRRPSPKLLCDVEGMAQRSHSINNLPHCGERGCNLKLSDMRRRRHRTRSHALLDDARGVCGNRDCRHMCP